MVDLRRPIRKVYCCWTFTAYLSLNCNLYFIDPNGLNFLVAMKEILLTRNFTTSATDFFQELLEASCSSLLLLLFCYYHRYILSPLLFTSEHNFSSFIYLGYSLSDLKILFLKRTCLRFTASASCRTYSLHPVCGV